MPWEERIEEAQERKREKYQELVEDCRKNGWRTRSMPVEVGSRGFASHYLYLLTLALDNLYFNTLDREKVQGKSLGCIKSRGTPPPRVVHPRYREPLQRDESAACGSRAAGCRPLA